MYEHLRAIISRHLKNYLAISAFFQKHFFLLRQYLYLKTVFKCYSLCIFMQSGETAQTSF